MKFLKNGEQTKSHYSYIIYTEKPELIEVFLGAWWVFLYFKNFPAQGMTLHCSQGPL